MPTDAFVLRYEFDEIVPFIATFLSSSDFDAGTLREICRAFGISYARKKKADLAQEIALFCERSIEAQEVVMQYLIGRNKGWFSVKAGRVSKMPECAKATELLVSEGESKWYGPISYPFNEDSRWYIKPLFIPHWEISDDQELQEYSIRWLCFARVTNQTISLHWRGFSHADSAESAQRYNSQFPYWLDIPYLFEDIEGLLHAEVDYIQLHQLVLHEMWDRYRCDESYTWLDRRIRAESGGVALSAHAGTVVEIEVAGIRRLAHTIRRSVEQELRTNHDLDLPEPDDFDEVILRTLIREFGTLSYEFSLEDDNDRLFRAHSYFGMKPNSTSPDSFPHMNVYTTWRDDLSQLRFLLQHL